MSWDQQAQAASLATFAPPSVFPAVHDLPDLTSAESFSRTPALVSELQGRGPKNGAKQTHWKWILHGLRAVEQGWRCRLLPACGGPKLRQRCGSRAVLSHLSAHPVTVFSDEEVRQIKSCSPSLSAALSDSRKGWCTRKLPFCIPRGSYSQGP